MFEHGLKIREIYYDQTENKYKLCEQIIHVNLNKVLTISYGKTTQIEGDYVRIVFENSSITGMVVN